MTPRDDIDEDEDDEDDDDDDDDPDDGRSWTIVARVGSVVG